ncbi:MAG: CHASE2 domain-containing protein, partial [Spirochaetota bacterium]
MTLNKNWLRKAGIGLLIGIFATGLTVVLWLPGVFDGFENKTWDWRAQLLAKPVSSSGEVVLILLDQNSLDWGKDISGLSWPWPREVYTYIVNFCKRGGVRSLAFDVLYTEPSPYGVYDDQIFGSSIVDFGNFIST